MMTSIGMTFRRTRNEWSVKDRKEKKTSKLKDKRENMSLYSTRRATPSALYASSPSSLAYSTPERMLPMEISSLSLDTVELGESFKNNPWQHLYVLPVLLLEFLALALTRAVLRPASFAFAKV